MDSDYSDLQDPGVRGALLLRPLRLRPLALWMPGPGTPRHPEVKVEVAAVAAALALALRLQLQPPPGGKHFSSMNREPFRTEDPPGGSLFVPSSIRRTPMSPKIANMSDQMGSLVRDHKTSCNKSELTRWPLNTRLTLGF